MKISFLLIPLLLITALLFSQKSAIDSLQSALKKEKTDTGRIILLFNLSLAYQDSKPDSALALAQDAYFKSKKIKFVRGESRALNQMAFAFSSIGNFPKALEYYIEQLKIEET